MNIETQIKLDKFKPREYQIPICDAIINKGYKRVLAILPRRAGKDIVAFNLCIRMALKEVMTIFYIFPTFSSGRRILWDSINNDGMRILDYCPLEVADRNEQLMRLRFRNGSTLQIIGSNDYDSALVGTNAKFMVFSEYSLQDPRAYQFARPILTANNGTALFLSTPRGHNHLWDLYQIAKNSPEDWFCYKLTVEDTKHISIEDIKKEIELGELSEGMANQEYFTSFDEGQDGYFYSRILDKMRLDGRIGIVPWEPRFKVHTAWDLGINDPTVIIYFQIVGQTVHIIDYYQASNRSIDHFVNQVLNKPYTYGKHFPPHDIMVREQGSGLTRREMYKQLGISFSEIYKLDLLDGIEVAKSALAKIWIDESKCKELIRHLNSYRQEWDEVRKQYKGIPLHDDTSHGADAFRYMCIALKKASFDGTTPEQLDKRYREAMYGNQLPGMFGDNNQY
jgi:phage terminase large subunit